MTDESPTSWYGSWKAFGLRGKWKRGRQKKTFHSQFTADSEDIEMFDPNLSV